MLKLWLDDVRPAPEGWRWCRTVPEACLMLEGRNITREEIEISFDHDLGDDVRHGTGYDLAKYLEGCAGSGKVFNVVRWAVHSANPVGRRNIEAAMRGFERQRAASAE